MKILVLILLVLCSSSILLAQIPSASDSAIINIYRKKQLYGSGTKIEIQVNSIPVIRLKSGERVSILTHILDTINIKSYNKLNNKFSANTVVIIPKAGEVSYVETNFWGDVFTPDRLIIYRPIKFGIDIFLINNEKGEKEFQDDNLFKDTKSTIQQINFPNIINPLKE